MPFQAAMLEHHSDVFVMYLAASVDWINTGDRGHTVDDIKNSIVVRIPSAFNKDSILRQKIEEFRDQYAYAFAGLANLFAQRRHISNEIASFVHIALFPCLWTTLTELQKLCYFLHFL